MPKFQLTNKAIEDLSVIWNYTYETWSEKKYGRSKLFKIFRNQTIVIKFGLVNNG